MELTSSTMETGEVVRSGGAPWRKRARKEFPRRPARPLSDEELQELRGARRPWDDEQVLRRQTLLRATWRGGLAGAWFGLLIGLFFGVFTTEAVSFLATVLWALIWGAAAGAVFGLIAHAMTCGKRDVVSHSQLAADRYEVLVPAEHVDRARTPVAPPTT